MFRRAASVILYRHAGSGPEDLEIYLVLRSPKLRFLGGCLAFPGGAVEAGDASLPMGGASDANADERELVGCAARELLEETGLLVTLPREASGPCPEARALLDGAASESLRRYLDENGLKIDGAAFTPIARLVTPAFSALRYDATFYLVETRGEPEVLPGELVSGEWRRPADALAGWRRGEMRIAPPAIVILKTFATSPLFEAIELLRAVPAEFEGSGRAIPYAPGYELLPLETPPLPPTIPTNTFFVGERSFLVVDPGPRLDRGKEHLVAAIDARLRQGDRLEAIVLTHHHPDHVGALETVAARYRTPVWAHERTGELLGRPLARELHEGDALALGLGPDGRPGWALRVLFTPGHDEGHIALHDERHRSLLAGDLVSTLVSMYVGAPGGNLRLYLASLRRIAALPVETLYPSHGAPAHEPAELIKETIRHRLQRIEEVFTRLTEVPRANEAIAEDVYPEGAASKLRPLVVRATRAALEYLVEDGRAVAAGGDRFAKAASLM